MKLWPGWLVVLAAACGSSPARSSTTTPESNQNPEPNATVVRVIDGDTIDASFDGSVEHVRLIGIDTPETKKLDTPIQCYGPQASAYTETLLPTDTPIYVERDVVGRDDYGRLLGYVYRSADGLFINLDLAAKGFAHVLTIPPNVAHSEDFVQAARDAEATNLGLWSSCNG